MQRHELTTAPEGMEHLGARLAVSLPAPEFTAAIVFLAGDLGAGKTTLARGFLRSRGHGGLVRSPTYTLLECYRLPDLTVVHLDLYRLQEAAELEALGLRELARPGCLWLVEWPERGAGRLPQPDIIVTLGAAVAGHTATLVAQSPFGDSWLAQMA